MLSLWLLTQDGVHEQHFSPVYVWRELGVVDFGFLRLLVALDEDLADANWATAVPEALLHGFTWAETNTDASVINSFTLWITQPHAEPTLEESALR